MEVPKLRIGSQIFEENIHPNILLNQSIATADNIEADDQSCLIKDITELGSQVKQMLSK